MKDSNKIYNLLMSVIFVLAIALPTIIWLTLSLTYGKDSELMKKIDFDLGENRNLAKYPTKFNSSTYTAELEAYYNDRVPFRSVIISNNSKVTSLLEDKYKDKVRPILVTWLYGEKTNEIEDEYLPPNIINEKVLEGKGDWLFYAAERSIEYYRGSNILEDEEMEKYEENLRKLQDICDKKGIILQIMFAPNKEQVYSEYMPNYDIENEYKRTSRFVQHIKETQGIEIIYLLDRLNESKKYGQLYYRYDTHWNELGAYIGTQELYKALGKELTDLESVKYIAEKKEGGDLVSLGALNNSDYCDDISYLLKYKENVHVDEQIEEYKNENGETFKIICSKSSADDCRRLVLIGDSFRMAMVPYLEKDFSECAIIYRDHASLAEAKEKIKNAEVLVVEAVERYDYNTIFTIENLIATLTAED